MIPAEGNHGEDLKEYYFYIDSTPTHSYMKYLYKYPQAEYPYEWLVALLRFGWTARVGSGGLVGNVGTVGAVGSVGFEVQLHHQSRSFRAPKIVHLRSLVARDLLTHSLTHRPQR